MNHAQGGFNRSADDLRTGLGSLRVPLDAPSATLDGMKVTLDGLSVAFDRMRSSLGGRSIPVGRCRASLDGCTVIHPAWMPAFAEDEPGFAHNFHTPASPSQTALLTFADAVLAELKQPGVAARFIAHELPAEFVKHLADDRKAIAEAQDVQEGHDSTGVASTAAIGRLIRAGMKEVTYLDAIIQNKYARNPDQLRAWLSASTIDRAPRRNKTAGTSSDTSAAPTPAAPAAPST